jgi:hypothetical protein
MVRSRSISRTGVGVCGARWCVNPTRVAPRDRPAQTAIHGLPARGGILAKAEMLALSAPGVRRHTSAEHGGQAALLLSLQPEHVKYGRVPHFPELRQL